MKLSELEKNYYCFDCKIHYTGDIKCPQCNKNGKHVGYDLKVSMSHAKLNVQEARRKHRKELLQPYREGQFSQEFKEAYPDKSRDMVKQGVISKKQYKNAKKVWGNDDVR